MVGAVGAFAALARRRATGSEQARGILADEQAALRRVATLVARQPSANKVFAAVTEEVAGLFISMVPICTLPKRRNGDGRGCLGPGHCPDTARYQPGP